MSKPAYKVMINGWYGHGNAGDDAILDIFIEQAQARLGCEVVVLSEQPQNIEAGAGVTAIFHPFAWSPLDALRKLLNGTVLRHARTLRQCDLFVLGGGGLLRDNTSWRNLVRLLDEIWLCKLMGRKTMLYAIGVGPFKSRLGKFLIGKTASMCDLVTVRSEANAELLRSVGVPAARIHVVADPAFLLGSAPPPDPQLVALLAGRDMVGVFPTISLLGKNGDTTRLGHIAEALDALHEQHGLRFAAFAMRFSPGNVDDVQMSNQIRAAMRHPEALVVWDKKLKPVELKWVTSQMRFNITVRLHAMIFSVGANVPAVPVNYEPKVANVFAAFDSPQFMVEMDEGMSAGLQAAAGRCLAELDDYRARLAAVNPANRVDAERTFELMEELCRSDARAAARLPAARQA